MRDQALMEQHRQAQERAAHVQAIQQQQQHQQQQQRPLASAMKVPLHSLSVDVPPQVLQVQTKLANPTRYHVMQKQKSQVRQYLSESFQAPSTRQFLQNLDNNGQIHSAPLDSVGNELSSATMPYSHSFQMSCPSPDAAAMSPALSSGATSTSEVSGYLYIDSNLKLSEFKNWF